MSDLISRLRPNQRIAAQADGKEIVVTAGAGTGKTSTLTGRALYFLESQPAISIDDFLIITFTRNAAAEMRERIAYEINQRAKNSINTGHWQKQRVALHQASIATLDSFCLDILRTYIHASELDPELQLIDQEDAALLETEVMAQVFDRLYALDDERGGQFRRLVAHLGGRGFDGDLGQRVRSLHGLSRVQPDPAEWLDLAINASTQLQGWRGDPENRWRQIIERQLITETAWLEQETNRAMAWASRLGALEVYEEFLVYVLDRTSRLLQANPRPLIERVPEAFPIGQRLPTKARSRELDEEAQALIEPLVLRVRQRINNRLRKGYINLLDPRLDELTGQSAATGTALLQLVRDYAEVFQKHKLDERVIDFADAEQYAYQLLARDQAIQDRLRNRYRHVLVDEVQDINQLQDAIIGCVADENKNNLFVVGDVKQSIYGFRLAQPRLLIEKLEEAEKTENATAIQRIDLKENFRSRKTVIEAVNTIFSRLMQMDFGGMAYDERVRLTYPEDLDEPLYQGPDTKVELCILEKPGAESIEGEAEEQASGDGPVTETDSNLAERDMARCEAIYLRRQIQDLFDAGSGKTKAQIKDRETGTNRDIEPRDIAILLRSPRTSGEVFASELQNAGFRVFAQLEGGYFDTPEIRDIESILRSIENPRQDIPFAAYLTSIAGGCSYSDLVRIRRSSETRTLWDAVQKWYQDAPESNLQQRVHAALEHLNLWRRDAIQKPLADLVWDVVHNTGVMAYALSQPLGPQRRANLLDFLDRARQFSRFHTQGLSRFLRYLEHLQERETQVTPPSTLAEHDNVIRIMSVHAAKGLEFPVVFLPQLGRQFNMQDTRTSAILDDELGPCLKHIAEPDNVRVESLAHKVAAQRRRNRDLQEELRIWYVALTRARERLYLIGTASWKNQPQRWYSAVDPESEALPVSYLESCHTPLDWFVPTTLASGASFAGAINLLQNSDPDCPIELRHLQSEEIFSSNEAEQDNDEDSQDILESDDSAIDLDQEDNAFIQETLKAVDWIYPYADVVNLSAKASVSDLKRAYSLTGEDGESVHPAILPPNPVRSLAKVAEDRQATKRGTATHRFLEHVSLEKINTYADLKTQLQGLIDRKLFSDDEAKLVDLQAVEWFFSTQIGQRFAGNPGSVYRECPFTLAASADEIWTQLKGQNYREMLHIQGVIDAMLVDDEITIVDYKTDRVPKEALRAYASRYHVQLQLYARAAKAILKKEVREAVLVFLTPKELVNVPI